MKLYDRLFRYDEVEKVLSGETFLQFMLDFEAALALASGEFGVIPSSSAGTIGSCCTLASLDPASLIAASANAGNIAIPFVSQLTASVRKTDPEAARYVHWGATSQDLIDSALVLQTRAALRLILADVDRICDRLAQLSREHRDTLMAGRTWLQHAAPITFGHKTAAMLSSLLWNRRHITIASEEFATVQLGGSVGTLPGFGDRGTSITASVARRLNLASPSISWHTARERLVNVAASVGILCGSLEKIARDISLMAQTEIGEVSERWEDGRGGSSTMPQKRNPIGCATVLSLCARVPGLVSTILVTMSQEHERALGGWQSEWETLPELLSISSGIVHHSANLLDGLVVNKAQMLRNIEITQGAIYAEAVAFRLAQKIGKSQAHELLAAASARALEQNRHLRTVLLEDSAVRDHLPENEIAELFDPVRHLGSSRPMIASVLKQYESERCNAVR